MQVPNSTNYFLFDLGMKSGTERPQYMITTFQNDNKKKEHCISPNICKCFSRSKIYRDRQCKILIITKEKLIIYNN